MNIIVQKFGGSSVATPEKLEQVAEHIIKERELDKDETTKKAINRLLNAKKKAFGVLEKYNLSGR